MINEQHLEDLLTQNDTKKALTFTSQQANFIFCVVAYCRDGSTILVSVIAWSLVMLLGVSMFILVSILLVLQSTTSSEKFEKPVLIQQFYHNKTKVDSTQLADCYYITVT